MKETKSDRTKQTLIQATLEIIVKHGFEGASISEIVRLTGLNRALVNYHFGSKDVLIHQVTDHVFSVAQIFTRESLQKRKESDLIERYVRTNFDWARRYPLHMNFLLLSIQKGYYDPVIRQKLDITFQRSQAGIAQLLLVQPHLSEKEREWVAVEIHSTLMGSIMNMFYGGIAKLDQFEERAVSASLALVRSRAT